MGASPTPNTHTPTPYLNLQLTLQHENFFTIFTNPKPPKPHTHKTFRPKPSHAGVDAFWHPTHNVRHMRGATRWIDFSPQVGAAISICCLCKPRAAAAAAAAMQ